MSRGNRHTGLDMVQHLASAIERLGLDAIKQAYDEHDSVLAGGTGFKPDLYRHYINLLDWANQEGIRVTIYDRSMPPETVAQREFQPLLDVLGLAEVGGREVVIDASLPPPAQFATLIHELLHILYGHQRRFWETRDLNLEKDHEYQVRAASYLIALDLNCGVEQYLLTVLIDGFCHYQSELRGEAGLPHVARVAIPS